MWEKLLDAAILGWSWPKMFLLIWFLFLLFGTSWLFSLKKVYDHKTHAWQVSSNLKEFCCYILVFYVVIALVLYLVPNNSASAATDKKAGLEYCSENFDDGNIQIIAYDDYLTFQNKSDHLIELDLTEGKVTDHLAIRPGSTKTISLFDKLGYRELSVSGKGEFHFLNMKNCGLRP